MSEETKVESVADNDTQPQANQVPVAAKKPVASIVLSAISLLLFAGCVLCAIAYYQLHQEIEHMRAVVDDPAFYQGVSVDGINVGGLPLEEAKALLQEHEAQQIARYQVTIAVDGKEFKQDVPVQTDFEQVLADAYAYARDGELDARFALVEGLKAQPIDWPLTYIMEEKVIDAMINRIATQVNVQAVDARVVGFDVETKTFEISEEVQGSVLSDQELLDQIQLAIAEDAFPLELRGKLDVVEAVVKKADLEKNYRQLSIFTTKTTSSESRNTNIRLATEAFNGMVIMPGETFSINAATGERSKAKGYRDAGAIKGGILVPEPGGGVCQVSTTLFNAAVRAGLTITERNNHSYPIDYVPRGHDAMINYPTDDLKLTNNGTGPVYLIGYFVDRRLTIEVYGTPILEDGVTIELRAETTANLGMPSEISQYDPTRSVGYRSVTRKGRTGYRMKTYTQLMKNGEVMEEKFLCDSYYRPIAPIVVYGSMPVYSGGATDTTGTGF